MFTDTLNGGHLLRILPLGRFQDGDNGTIRVLATDGSDDGFVVRREAICTIVLTITDDCQIVIHIITQSHCPDITGVRGIAAHGDICEGYTVAIGLSQVILKKRRLHLFLYQTMCFSGQKTCPNRIDH